MPFDYCIATSSLGSPKEPLVKKLDVVAENNFHSIELALPDLIGFTNATFHTTVGQYDFEALMEGAKEVFKLCEERQLKVGLLQPFARFEGLDRESKDWSDTWLRVKGWIQIMLALQCKTLQVGSSDSTKIVRNRKGIVEDLRMLATELEKENLRCAYENWCWSKHAPTWQDVWDICKNVGMHNFGLCLDTFQIAASEWGDPTRETGLIQRVGGEKALEERFDISMVDLAQSIPKEKIFLLQISDAYLPQSPIKTTEHQHARLIWSETLRPLPFQGVYLPVEKITAAVRETGFEGPFSIETFDSTRAKDQSIDEYAKICMGHLRTLVNKEKIGSFAAKLGKTKDSHETKQIAS